MPSYSRHINAMRPQIRWLIPAGCTPRANVDWPFLVGTNEKQWNSRDTRPKPANLLDNLTGQATQATYISKGPVVVHTSTVACGHGGIHGDTKRLFYQYLPDTIYGTAHSDNLWAQRARENLESLNINLGTSLAEYRQSTRMFGNAARSLKTTYDVLRGRYRRKKLRACSIPASYLQYTFGVAPLVSDLYDSVESLKLRLEKPLRRRISVFKSENISGSRENLIYTDNWSSRMSQRATIYATLDPAATSQFTIGNPIEWAWELIPFSFVVDWMIPIGNFLGSLDALKGISDIKGTVTTKTVYRSKRTAGGDYSTVSPGSTNVTSHSRTGISGIPIPNPPKWSPSKSLKSVRTGLFLLWGINKRCRK